MSPERKTGRTGGSRAAGTGTASGSKPRRKKASGPGLLRRVVKWGLLTVLFLLVLGAAAFAYGYASIDVPNPNKDFQTQTSIVYYANGKSELGRFATQNRISIPLGDVPQHAQDAVVAAENRSFYSDRGIDPKGIVRAAFSNATSNTTQGASTITQQYVKVLYLSQDRTWKRKVKEAFLSLKIERQMSKSQILEGYLNTIYFGRGAYGIEAAAQAYFDEDAKDLNLRQSAVLAAVLNSPGNLDPAEGDGNRARLLQRYHYVLSGMRQMGNITPAKADRAARRLPKFPQTRSSNTYGGQRGHLLTLVKKELHAQGFTDSEISGGGLRVTTTFTHKAMRAARQAVHEQRPDDRGPKHLHVAVASVEPGTGALRGMFAGQNYLNSQINWAEAGGSPGSSFKPFAMAAAIKDGFSLKDTFQGNSPYRFPGGDTVVNEGPGQGNDYGASVSMLTAIEQSINTAFVDMTVSMDNGPRRILDTAVDLGIPRDAPGLKPNSGISLGSATVSPVDMANAYASIADGGRTSTVHAVAKVESASGKELYAAQQDRHRVISRDIASDVSYGLQQVVKQGTGTAAQDLGRPAAGKTGTATNGNGDVSSSWFVGYTPQLSTAVMYVRGDGNDKLNGYLLPHYFGADYPARTWTAAMHKALQGTPVRKFPAPAYVDGKAPTQGHSPQPTYTPTPQYTPSPTSTPSQSPTPTSSPSPTPSPTPTSTPSPTLTPSPPPPSPSSTCGGGIIVVGPCPSSPPSRSPTGGPSRRGPSPH